MARDFHSMGAREALKSLGATPEGLPPEEVLSRLETYGQNYVEQKPRATWASILARQFRSIPILLLIAASAISFFIGHTLDGIAISFAVLLSISFGFLQEHKAERALEALSKLTIHKTLAVRGGKDVLLDSRELVPGDIVIIKEGDRVPADMRIVECANLLTDEASLTGESRRQAKGAASVPKDAPLAERTSMVYAGTVVLAGKATCVAVETGARTEFGKIQKSISAPKEELTPLQKKLDEFGKQIGVAGILLSVVFFAGGALSGQPLSQMFVLSVALAVAAIPEGLPTIVTLTLAIGMQKMAKRKAVVRKLPAVETLGSATVVCTDKTGTLTENKMCVTRAWVGGCFVKFSGTGYGVTGAVLPEGKGGLPQDCREQLAIMLRAGSLCNSAHLVFGEGQAVPEVSGDPTEGAILVAAEKSGVRTHELHSAAPLVAEAPFDPARKMMTSVRKEGKKLFSYSKGAPESILPRCKYMLQGGRRALLTKSGLREIEKAERELSRGALRVMAFSFREISHKQVASVLPQDERGMVFAGLVGMADPPRQEAAEAVSRCKEAGIRVVMITGDAHQTAMAIARQLLIASGEGEGMEGRELDSMSDADLQRAIGRVRVFSRTTPEHKRRIVEAFLRKGEIVAVTGDGINDAPSIKLASIGISMGTTGAEVTKEVSDMVLMDDNFATIVRAIEYGRTLLGNIRNFIRFEFSTTVAALTVMFSAPLLGLPLPLNALQILWINLIMDGPPALALGLEPRAGDEMRRKPANPKEPFITPRLFLLIFITGITMASGTLAILHVASSSGNPKAGTLAFTTFVMFQLLNAFNCRSPTRSAFKDIFTNRYLFLAVVASFLLQLLIIYNPFFEEIFQTVPLDAMDWLVVMAIASSIVAVEEIRKRLFGHATS